MASSAWLTARHPSASGATISPLSAWRKWIIDAPAHITEVAAIWYRLYLIVTLVVIALTLPALVLTALAFWFGFGIRWGW